NTRVMRADQPLNEDQMRRVSALASPSPALGVFRIPPPLPENAPLSKGPALYLDGIRDPGNLGTILRVADWFGIPEVILAPDCVDLFNPKVVQASMGSIARVRVRVMDYDALSRFSPKRPLIGTAMDGMDLYSTAIPPEAIVVIGNESHGIRDGLMPLLQRSLRIPPHAEADRPMAESLNAAIAAAIICAEWRRSLRT
ncbi:MAG TPA: RNA methyltransferase, partial [Bacteroidales bacterium]|nr:RNA methyltransferase [Bacteroidales bacterium]